jgi:hypothetical protein
LTFGEGSCYFQLLKCMIRAVVRKNTVAGLKFIGRIYPHPRNNDGGWGGSVLAVISSVRKIEDRTGRRGGGVSLLSPLGKEGGRKEKGTRGRERMGEGGL